MKVRVTTSNTTTAASISANKVRGDRVIASEGIRSIDTGNGLFGGPITFSGTISANSANLTQAGIVQLNDSISSSSTTQAATPNAVLTVAGITTSAYEQANSAYSQANDAFDRANVAYGQASLAYDAANNAAVKVTANSGTSFSANTLSFNNTATVSVVVEQNGSNANVSFVAAPQVIVDDTFTAQGNTSAAATANIANGLYLISTSAYNQANLAYNAANLKLNLSGGTITGSLNIAGNLTIVGNTTYQNVTTYIVDDPLIYLAANNDLSDLVDIGFMGGHNTAGVYQHSGLARHAADGDWYLFTGLAEEGHENNVIDIANTTYATLKANINAQSIIINGNTAATNVDVDLAYTQANLAYTQANTATSVAQSAYAQANTGTSVAQSAFSQANSAYTQANDAYAQANTGTSIAQSAYAQANLAYDAANNAAVKVTANAGTTISANTLSFNNTSSIAVSVEGSGSNANISFVSTNAVSSKFTTDGNSNTFTLSTEVSNVNNLLVTIDGIVIIPVDDYDVSSANLILTFMPPSGLNIEARTLR